MDGRAPALGPTAFLHASTTPAEPIQVQRPHPMTTVTRTALIEAGSEDVWTVLADFGAISAWLDMVDHSSLLTDCSDGVGMARRVQMGNTTAVETVSAWKPGVLISYDITGLPPIVKSVTNTWRLGASGDTTMISIVTDVDAGSNPVQRAIAKGFAQSMAKSADDMLAALNAYLIKEHPHESPHDA